MRREGGGLKNSQVKVGLKKINPKGTGKQVVNRLGGLECGERDNRGIITRRWSQEESCMSCRGMQITWDFLHSHKL